MTGKVFHDSANVYQDQAKILFEYYKKAAEKIVSEQKKLEELKTIWGNLLQKKKIHKLVFMILFILMFSASLVVFITSIVKGALKTPFYIALESTSFAAGVVFLVLFIKALFFVKQCEEKLLKFDEEYKNIRTDYAVNKIGVVYVPVATRVPFEGKSFLVDHTKKVGETNFQLTVMNNPDSFKDSLGKLQEGMDKIPVVENNEMPEEVDTSNYSTSMQNIILHDHVGNIDRQVRNISFLLNDSEKISVSLPVIKPESREEKFVEQYATSDTGNKPVLNVFDIEGFDVKLKNFSSLNSMKDQIKTSGDSDNTEYMKKLMVQLAETVQLLTKTKTSGSSKLINYTTKIFENVLKSSYNEYSPSLEAEEIERIRTANFDYQSSVNDYKPFSLKQGSRVKYDLLSGNWVAEDGSRTSMPFGMHQVDEEVLMPVIQNLMEENRVERLKIYNSIEDQKRSYLEKWTSETGAYFRDNRKAADELITHMREAYADYTSSATTYKSLMKTQEMLDSQGVQADGKVVAEDAQDEMVAGFEIQASQCNRQQEEFADFMDRIQDDINESKERFGHVEYYEASLRDSESHNMAVSMAEVQNLDSRKKQLVGVSPYFANNADLPPLPNTQLEMMEDVDINLVGQVKENLDALAAAEAEARERKAAEKELLQEEEESGALGEEPCESGDSSGTEALEEETEDSGEYEDSGYDENEGEGEGEDYDEDGDGEYDEDYEEDDDGDGDESDGDTIEDDESEYDEETDSDEDGDLPKEDK